MNKHETVNIKINGQSISIDRNIVKIVQWLNGFWTVRTLFSCEGDGPNSLPYVLFLCEDPADLCQILKKLDTPLSPYDILRFGYVKIDLLPTLNYDPMFGDLDRFRYCLEFFSLANRDAFSWYLESNEVIVPDDWRRKKEIEQEFPVCRSKPVAKDSNIDISIPPIMSMSTRTMPGT